jgi:hypothetical protein
MKYQLARVSAAAKQAVGAAQGQLKHVAWAVCLSVSTAGISPVVLAAETATPAIRTAPATRTAILADWSRGVWQSSAKTYFISGFKDEDEYDDPKVQWTNPPPLTPRYAARYNEIRQAAFEGRNIYDQGSNCSPLGVPFMAGFGSMEILSKPGQITMVYEEDGGVRRIFTDGRPHPVGDDLIPTYNGHSTGHWEGKTLVVDTVGLRDDTYIEVGMPHSSQLHVIERWTQIGPDEITNTVTLIDPEALTKPWGTTWKWKRHADWAINEVFCVAPRETKVDGATTMIGPDGKPLLGPSQKGGTPPASQQK